MTKKLNLEHECGRSMVEMLGVLAIIGVLTVGGIAGYTYAMNKYRTNEVLDGASKRAITVATQLAIEAQPDLTEYTNDNEVAGGTFSTDVTEYDNGQFGLNISGVKKAVCEGLVKTAGGKVALRGIIEQGTEELDTDMTPDKCKDENNLVLIFNNSASAKDSEESRAGGSSGGNCWTSATGCGQEDVDSSFEAWCGGAVHTKEYCVALANDEMGEGVFVTDDEYTGCRKAGYPLACCDGGHVDGSFETWCTCRQSGKSNNCCHCLAEGGGDFCVSQCE